VNHDTDTEQDGVRLQKVLAGAGLASRPACDILSREGRVRGNGPLAPERAIGLGLQVCDALMAAHEGPEPVVHRDLKLENLMPNKDRSGGEMGKVPDFGIHKAPQPEA